MPNWINSAREFLGLGQDPYYDDYDSADDNADPVGWDDPADHHEPERSRQRVVRPSAMSQPDGDWDESDKGVRVISAVPEPAEVSKERNVVRPLPTTSRPEVVNPTRFDDVQLVADAFKKVQPVIVNLQGVDRDLSRRLIDFSSGLCYGLEGVMERVADQVFLLTPKGAEVSADDRRQFEQGPVAETD